MPPPTRAAYSIFRADVTDLCHDGDNELTIEVSNEDTPSMYPASADFTFYGGLYRGVNLISVPNTHFDLDYFGGPGIKVTPKPAEDGGATFEIKSYVTNPDEDFTVQYSIEDPYGCEVASATAPDNTAVTLYVPDAELWSMDEPNLYTVIARLQRCNESYDESVRQCWCAQLYRHPGRRLLHQRCAHPAARRFPPSGPLVQRQRPDR